MRRPPSCAGRRRDRAHGPPTRTGWPSTSTQNPYVREVDAGRIVLPELATAYTDRSLDLPGMIHADGLVVAAFGDIGWTWGGDFQSLFDPHHFSATGR